MGNPDIGWLVIWGGEIAAAAVIIALLFILLRDAKRAFKAGDKQYALILFLLFLVILAIGIWLFIRFLVYLKP